MFSSFDTVHQGGRRARFWQMFGNRTAIRRSINPMLCRLPFVGLCMTIVIFILYVTFASEPAPENEAKNGARFSPGTVLPFTASRTMDNRPAYEHVDAEQPTRRRSSGADRAQEAREQRTNIKQMLTTIEPSSAAETSVKSNLELSSTINRESPPSIDYTRQSKVFILLVQDETASPSQYRSRRHHQQAVRSPSFTIPAHIRLVTSILDAHRINYDIDIIRTSLPALLLADQQAPSDKKRYSVIVIDDFMRYTSLNRWVRDQLDRHCRANQIGVIGYLTAARPILDAQQLTSSRPGPRSARSQPAATARQMDQSAGSSTEHLLSDSFPLTFRPIDRKSCPSANKTSRTIQLAPSPTSCLADYQVNERSPILRILKRRRNFILDGPLASNLNQWPWVSMSSNHESFEPLTWARLASAREQIETNEAKKQVSKSALAAADAPISGVKPDGYDYDHYEPLELPDDTPGAGLAQQDQQQNSSRLQARSPVLRLVSGASLQARGDTVSPFHLGAASDLGPAGETSVETGDDGADRLVLSMFDRGLFDGIKRVIFGGANHHWLNRILLLDSIEHLSSGKIIGPLERFIQIDVDDIFVGEKGKRMHRADVDALVEAQANFSRLIPDFRFNLGFSGRYFKHGDEAENEGDEELIKRAHEFTWFCHMWAHTKAHLYNDSQSIEAEIRKNLEFAEEKGILMIGHDRRHKVDGHINATLPGTYAVAPHHSGVYPVHEQLYNAWKRALNVQVTSTEEYPHLRPASRRRAFVHKAIKVLPRQTCGLYTHTIYRRRYPGGIAKLETSIRGGELFETVLHNPVNIYMTHMSNYANDRLGLFTFSELFDFVRANTNLQLRYARSGPNQLGPLQLADYYLSLHPAELQPLWTNPCSDKRHLAIWAASKQRLCKHVPRMLIVGPQKTGTTALLAFLKLNPLFESSRMSALDYEEVQFFNDKHYPKGVDWYLSRFQQPSEGGASNNQTSSSTAPKQTSHHFNESTTEMEWQFFVDKSATYFDDPKVPERAQALLPDARIIILLVDPADRAYSWYQHMRAHGDPIASTVSFEQVILAREPISNPKLLALRNRCLHPGYYSQHLTRWLDHFAPRQIVIIDGQWFKTNPVAVMDRLQLVLRVTEPVEYAKLLIYDELKGFYCPLVGSNVKCLGASKGRRYGPMSQEARRLLNRHYWPHNRQLARILLDIGQPLPTWLDETITLSQAAR